MVNKIVQRSHAHNTKQSATRRTCRSSDWHRENNARSDTADSSVTLVRVREVPCDQRRFQLRITVEGVIGAPAEFEASRATRWCLT